MRRTLFLLITGLFITNFLVAQVKIGDNPQNIDPASVLELESTDKVLVITRVTTVQMNAITPLQGAMVYNTDLQSVHYYDGTQWVNVGGGGTGGPLTADAIVNPEPTIVITPTGTGDNLEVAPNSIDTEQIKDGAVTGTDIADGSIGPGKIQDQSVTQDKLSENSVGVFAIDNDNLPVSAFNNDVGYITSGDIISADAGNVLESRPDGAFYNDDQLIIDIADTDQKIDDHVALDNDVSNTNEIQILGLNGTELSLSNGGGFVTLPSTTGEIDDNELITDFAVVGTDLVITEAGTDYAVPLASLGAAATVINSTATVTVMGSGTTGDPFELTAVGGGGTTEEVDDILLSGVGTNADPFTIKPGGADQILRTNTAGDAVSWVDLPTGGASITDGTTIIGDGSSVLTALALADDAVTTAKILDANVTDVKIAPGGADQILRTAPDGLSVGWVDLPTGGASITDGTTITGDGSSALTALALADDAVTTAKIENETILLEDIAPNGATADGEILQWNTTLNAGAGGWEVAVNSGHLGTNQNNVFFAGPGGVPYDTESNDDATTASRKDNGGFFWDSSKRFNTGALYLGLKGNGASETAPLGPSPVGDHSKLVIAERYDAAAGTEFALAFPLQLVNESTVTGGGTGLLFAIDTQGNPGKGALVYERTGAEGQGDFHFISSNTTASVRPTISEKVLTIENDGDVVLTGNVVDKNGIGATPPLVTDPENGYVLTNTTAGTVWAAPSGGGVLTGTTIDGNGTSGNELEISNDAVTTVKITNGAVNTDKIADGTILAQDLADMGAANDQVLKWNGTVWAPAADAGGTAYSAGTGLTLTGTDFSVNDLAGEVTGPPTATLIANDAVTTAKILDGNVTPAKLQAPTLPLTADQILVTDMTTGNVTWQDLSTGGMNLATENLTQEAEDRTYNLNGQELVFNGVGGQIGIGNFGNPGAPASVRSKLDVDGQITASNGFAASEGSSGNPGYGFFTNGDSDTGMFRAAEDELGFSVGGNDALRILANQNVGIGVVNPMENLHVAGNIRTDGSFLSLDNVIGVPDYVFEKYFLGRSSLKEQYNFHSLEEIEDFVKKNHHLPGITSAIFARKQGYWNLSESNLQNLEKIEELFLHTIEQEKKIKKLAADKESQAKELDALRKELEEIKALLKIK